MEDPIEFYPPSGDHFLIVFRVEKSGEQITSALFGDVSLDLGYGPAIESVVSELWATIIPGLTHVVNCPIASPTDRLNSFNLLPSIPRSRARHTSAQASPSSM